jgi:hypothetical protein
MDTVERDEIYEWAINALRSGATIDSLREEIESVWALLKRGIYGTWHHISAKHVARYVNEVTFRLNAGNVANHTFDRLDSFIRAVDGQRLTYERLTA